MIIKKFLLENYGLYAGKNVFALEPKRIPGQNKNIVLIGGKNGVGKTTFLNALRLAFYGKSSLGKKVGRIEYDAYLRNQIHQSKNSVLENTFARLSVEFRHTALGEYKDYQVERSWQIEGKSIKEFLKISYNGQPLEAVTDEYWNGFIEEIIPERLSQLFFFDGEKIQEIARETTENRVLAEAIKTLLGLDIVQRLQADLSIYKTREVKNASLNSYKKQSDEIDKKISTVKKQIQVYKEELAGIKSSIDGNWAEISHCESRLNKEGGHFASLRAKNIEYKDKLGKNIIQLEESIRNECIDVFPFSLCPTINELLRTQIREERDLNRHLVVENEIRNFGFQILSGLADVSFENESDKKAVEVLINNSAEKRAEYHGKLTEDERILNFSETLAAEILHALEKAEKASSPTVQGHAAELENAQNRLREITKNLAQAPDESQIKPLFEKLTALNQRQGELQQQKKQLEDRILSQENELKMLQLNLKKLTEKQKVHGRTQSRIKMVNKIDSILDLYYKKLRDAKTEQLIQTFSEGFNHLMSKHMIDRLSIDKKTFETFLYDHSGKIVSKESFSSGEKQLYAIAMLWSLAKTSGRPLPVIIDTPLGRLDSRHRANLIENYYPRASHQVIILSTDTEIDQNLYLYLEENLSHCYELKYDPEQGRTTPVNGYFWEEETRCLN